MSIIIRKNIHPEGVYEGYVKDISLSPKRTNVIFTFETEHGEIKLFPRYNNGELTPNSLLAKIIDILSDSMSFEAIDLESFIGLRVEIEVYHSYDENDRIFVNVATLGVIPEEVKKNKVIIIPDDDDDEDYIDSYQILNSDFEEDDDE